MRTSLDQFDAFYHSPLGQLAQRAIAARIASSPQAEDAHGRDDAPGPEDAPHPEDAPGRDDALGRDTTLSFGYARPWLDALARGTRGQVIWAAPASQGGARWPSHANACTLTGETLLPFAGAVFDRLLVVHGLEEADDIHALLREFWRIAAPEARLLLIAANRLSPWAMSETSPFGRGRTFLPSDLDTALRTALFVPEKTSHALYTPPWGRTYSVARAEKWEKTGARLWPCLGGVIVIEARKHLYALPSGGQPARRHRQTAHGMPFARQEA